MPGERAIPESPAPAHQHHRGEHQPCVPSAPDGGAPDWWRPRHRRHGSQEKQPFQPLTTRAAAARRLGTDPKATRRGRTGEARLRDGVRHPPPDAASAEASPVRCGLRRRPQWLRRTGERANARFLPPPLLKERPGPHWGRDTSPGAASSGTWLSSAAVGTGSRPPRGHREVGQSVPTPLTPPRESPRPRGARGPQPPPRR